VDQRSHESTAADFAGKNSVVLAAPDQRHNRPVERGTLSTQPVDTTAGKSSLPQDTGYYSFQHHPWNSKAIASLPIAVATVVTGIATQSIYILLIGGAISFALGLVASRQCRDRGDHGKGLVIVAMVLGAAALFFSLMALITAA
jgi:hypothetical protein